MDLYLLHVAIEIFARFYNVWQPALLWAGLTAMLAIMVHLILQKYVFQRQRLVELLIFAALLALMVFFGRVLQTEPVTRRAFITLMKKGLYVLNY